MLVPLVNAHVDVTNQARGPEFGLSPVADPGFLERGFICIKVRGFVLLIFLKYPMKMK